MAMYTRSLRPPSRSFFLFGPRGVGKSTWLRQHFKKAKYVNLLETDTRLSLLREPASFRHQVQALAPGDWVVVDEIQLVPELLSEVHALIESNGYKFAMSGSSARKIVRGQANLLAGRAVMRNMLPLTFQEVGDADKLLRMIDHGALPMVVDGGHEWSDILAAYTLTYLREEIQAEALVRNLGAFSRFLECAALANAQVTNISSLARDAGVQRPTVQGYFQLLQDTLLGHMLPAWRPRARIKEQAHPKFYWFDSGVARAMANRLQGPVTAEQRGPLLETFLFHELRAYMHYYNSGGTLTYWRTPAGNEVDFIWSDANGKTVALEVKAGRRWRKEFRAGLDALGDSIAVRKLGVYLGDARLVDDDLEVLPLSFFLTQLYAGKIIG